MKIKRTKGEVIFGVINTVFMVVMAFVTLYPLWHVLMASFSVPTRIMAHRGLLFWTLGFSNEAYVQVFKHPLLVRSYMNTIFYVLVGTGINMVMTFHGAWKGKERRSEGTHGQLLCKASSGRGVI